jgi:hypothetical protein
VQAPEDAVHERGTLLRLLVGALGQAQVPNHLIRQGVRRQERVLLAAARLPVLPTRPQHVPASVDQLLRVLDRILIDCVGNDQPILPQRPRSGSAASCSGAAPQSESSCTRR